MQTSITILQLRQFFKCRVNWIKCGVLTAVRTHFVNVGCYLPKKKKNYFFYLKLLDGGSIVRCEMIAVDNSIFLVQSNQAPTKNTKPRKELCEKGTYAHYLSYATLVRFVAYVRVEIFQLPCGHIFILFLRKITILRTNSLISCGNLPNAHYL